MAAVAVAGKINILYDNITTTFQIMNGVIHNLHPPSCSNATGVE